MTEYTVITNGMDDMSPGWYARHVGVYATEFEAVNAWDSAQQYTNIVPLSITPEPDWSKYSFDGRTPSVPVYIPDGVRDNSETVTDYAFMRHRSPDKGIRSVTERDTDIENASRLGYVHYGWVEWNPDGQRCRFDMLINEDGQVVGLFHTEYFTRIGCLEGTDWQSQPGGLRGAECSSYAVHFVRSVADGKEAPLCEYHIDALRRAVTEIRLSETLHIGQHT